MVRCVVLFTTVADVGEAPGSSLAAAQWVQTLVIPMVCMVIVLLPSSIPIAALVIECITMSSVLSYTEAMLQITEMDALDSSGSTSSSSSSNSRSSRYNTKKGETGRGMRSPIPSNRAARSRSSPRSKPRTDRSSGADLDKDFLEDDDDGK